MDWKDKNAGIWLVVNPTVGLPLFFIAIMITSLVIHFAILTNTTWFGAYWQGKAKPAATSEMVPGRAATQALASN